MKFKSIIRKIAVVLVVIAAIYFPFYITQPTPRKQITARTIKSIVFDQNVARDKTLSSSEL